METKNFYNGICVEILAINDEGTTIHIRKDVEDRGIHQTYMRIYDTLMSLSKNTKWEIKYINTKNKNSL